MYFFRKSIEISLDLLISRDFLKASLMEKLMKKNIFCGVLVNKNDRLYGNKNCLRNHCDICFSFLGSYMFHNFVTAFKNEITCD